MRLSSLENIFVGTAGLFYLGFSISAVLPNRKYHHKLKMTCDVTQRYCHAFTSFLDRSKLWKSSELVGNQH